MSEGKQHTSGEGDGEGVVEQGPHEVHSYPAERCACEVHGDSDVTQIVAHQHYVCTFNCHISTFIGVLVIRLSLPFFMFLFCFVFVFFGHTSAKSNSHIGLSESDAIVHPITHEAHGETLVLQLLHACTLLCWHHLTEDMVLRRE